VALAGQIGCENVITVDMGGTSFDVCLAFGGELKLKKEEEIGGHAVKIPMLDINTIGAGGGSIAWIDSGGALRVGPKSAGAIPGPACYGLGGDETTVTDANLVLGRLNPENFLGGEMQVDIDAAFEAIEAKIASPLNLGVFEAAEGIIKVINAAMVKGIRFVSVERGFDPREFTLMAFGGSGPLHAVELAEELDIPRVVVPIAPGVTSALGLLLADFRRDYVRTYLHRLEEIKLNELEKVYTKLTEEARETMLAEGILAAEMTMSRSVELRYFGQGYELEVGVPDSNISKNWLDVIAQRFHQLHQQMYGFSHPEEPVELVNLRLAVVARLPHPEFNRESSGISDAKAALTGGFSTQITTKGKRKVFLKGKFTDTAIYDREQLQPGDVLEGPSIIEQKDSTTLIFAGQSASVDEYRNLLIDVKPQK
jgi:N-methylhydantoinase A